MQRGSTLIELMIGIAIVGTLLALGIPGFSAWIQNTQIRTAAESVQNGLQLARAEAVRRNTDVQFAQTGANWTVGCATAIEPGCPASIQTRSGAEGSANAAITPSEVLSSGAAAGTSVFTGTVIFNGLGRVNTTSLGAGNNASFLVTNIQDKCVLFVDTNWSDSSEFSSPPPIGKFRCLRVLVSTGGQIRMCDPAMAGPNDPDPTKRTPLGC